MLNTIMEDTDIDHVKASIRTRIGSIIAGTIDDLSEMWLEMFSPQTTADNLAKLVDHVQSFLCEICEETVNRRDLIQSNIADLGAERRRLERLLQCAALDETAAQLQAVPLFNHQVLLDQQLQSLRDQLDERQSHIRQLCAREAELCRTLCERLLGLPLEPLPSASDIAEFEFRMEELAGERSDRQQRIARLCSSIRGVCALMEMEVPRDTAGQLVREYAADPQMPVSAACLSRLAELERQLLERQRTIRQEIGELLAQLARMYALLEMPEDERAVRLPETAVETRAGGGGGADLSCVQLSDAEAVECGMRWTKTTVDAVRTELERCKRIRRQNIQMLVEKVRRGIEELWERAMRSDRERARFTHFTNDCYTEDLLYLHELEQTDLQHFCDDNAELFARIREHQTLWERLLALEAKEKEPGRYQNRGGQLLAEERERRVIGKKLPKIIADIERMEEEFGAENGGRAFTVWGVPVRVHIERLHAEREAQRVKQSSARKEATRTPGQGAGASMMMGTSSAQRSIMGAPRTPIMSVSKMQGGAGGSAMRTGGAAGGAGGSTLKRMASTTAMNLPNSISNKKARIHTVAPSPSVASRKPVNRSILSELATGKNATAQPPNAAAAAKTPRAGIATPSKLAPPQPHRFVRPNATPSRPNGRPAGVVDTLAMPQNKRRSRRKSHNKSTSKAAQGPRVIVTDCSSSQADESYDAFQERVKHTSRSSVLPSAFGEQQPPKSSGAGHTPAKTSRRKSRPSMAIIASAARAPSTLQPGDAHLMF